MTRYQIISLSLKSAFSRLRKVLFPAVKPSLLKPSWSNSVIFQSLSLNKNKPVVEVRLSILVNVFISHLTSSPFFPHNAFPFLFDIEHLWSRPPVDSIGFRLWGMVCPPTLAAFSAVSAGTWCWEREKTILRWPPGFVWPPLMSRHYFSDTMTSSDFSLWGGCPNACLLWDFCGGFLEDSKLTCMYTVFHVGHPGKALFSLIPTFLCQTMGMQSANTLPTAFFCSANGIRFTLRREKSPFPWWMEVSGLLSL